MKNIQLVAINAIDRGLTHFEVIVHSEDDGRCIAFFDCDSEHDAVQLRNAIREHSVRLRSAHNYRDKSRS